MKSIVKIALLATSVSAMLATPVMARRGADDPVGHVRQEDRQADRQADRSSSTASDRSSASASDRSTAANDVRREDRRADRRADRTPR